MKALKLPVGVDGSCNFCKRGKRSNEGHRLVYPYQHVFKVVGNNTSFNICEDCLEELSTNLTIVEDYSEL